MKKKSIIISKIISTVFLFLIIVAPVDALTPTTKPTVSPATTETEKEQKLIDQINNLKEKVASKVAELRLVEKRGVIVATDQVTGNKITATDMSGKTRFIDVDELTKFSSPSAKESFGISDITKGTRMSVIGLYNKQSKRILARFVDVITTPMFLNGTVTNVDKANFTVTIVSEDNQSTVVDIENVTKTSSYTEEDDIVRAGFTKITAGDRAHVVGYADANQKNRVTATRVLLLSELPKNPKVKTSEVVEEEVTPTISSRPTTSSRQ